MVEVISLLVTGYWPQCSKAKIPSKFSCSKIIIHGHRNIIHGHVPSLHIPIPINTKWNKGIVVMAVRNDNEWPMAGGKDSGARAVRKVR